MKLKRKVVKIKKVCGTDDAFAAAPAAKLVSFIWELTKEIWSLRGEGNVKRRLQRNITNLYRQEKGQRGRRVFAGQDYEGGLMNKRIITAIIFTCFLLAAAAQARAEGDYNAAEKLGRGLANIFTGWVEIPAEFGRIIQKKGDIASFFVAPFTGFAKAVGRTAVGMYDALTFPIPLPAGYKPVIEPEFVMENDDVY